MNLTLEQKHLNEEHRYQHMFWSLKEFLLNLLNEKELSGCKHSNLSTGRVYSSVLTL
jgi:hypothetical protein